MTGLYLYQTVHLARGRARNVAGHIAVLDAASRELFGRPYAPAAERLAKRIETLSAAERYPAGVSGFVRIELDPDGTERLLPAGVSLYDGYAFRSLQPEAVTVGYDLTLSEAPTSAREAAAQLARRLAERRGAEVAVRCDSAGILRSADDAPLLAIAGRTVLTAPGPASVERRLAVLAVQAAAKAVAVTDAEIRTPLRDTVVVRIHDTLPVRDTVRMFRWRDPWISVEGRIGRDSAACRIRSVDTLRQAVHRIPRRFLFIRWGTKALRQEIVSTNPHTRIVYAEYVKIER